MQTDIFDRLDDLSQGSRQKLNEQIERVQEEARRLRMQARRLRRAQHAETKQRKKLLAQIAQSGKEWGQSVLQRGGDLTAAASSQLRLGQKATLKRGGNLVQGMGQRGGQTSQNLADWRDDTTRKLRRQGRQMAQNATDWGDDTTYTLRKQGRNMTRNVMDWGDEALYKLRKQGQYIAQNVADWGDEAAYKLRRQGQYVAQNLTGRRGDVTRKLRKQSRAMSRDLADRRELAARKLRKQGRDLTLNLADRRELATRKLRRQGRNLSRRGGELLEPVRENKGKVWTIAGFFAGLLVAGGITYWLIKRGFGRTEREEEERIELPQRDTLNGVVGRPGGEIRYASQGATAVAARLSTTSAGPTSKFVGVLSTRQYYPIEQQPDARDLVFFETEEDARIEGFTAADY